jgi:hypothetical protein
MSALEVRGYFGEHAAARDTHSNRYQLVDEAPVFVDCPVTVIVHAVATAIENGLVDQGIAIVVDTRRTTASRGFALVVSRVTGGRAQWVRDARAALGRSRPRTPWRSRHTGRHSSLRCTPRRTRSRSQTGRVADIAHPHTRDRARSACTKDACRRSSHRRSRREADHERTRSHSPCLGRLEPRPEADSRQRCPTTRPRILDTREGRDTAFLVRSGKNEPHTRIVHRGRPSARHCSAPHSHRSGRPCHRRCMRPGRRTRAVLRRCKGWAYTRHQGHSDLPPRSRSVVHRRLRSGLAGMRARHKRAHFDRPRNGLHRRDDRPPIGTLVHPRRRGTRRRRRPARTRRRPRTRPLCRAHRDTSGGKDNRGPCCTSGRTRPRRSRALARTDGMRRPARSRTRRTLHPRPPQVDRTRRHWLERWADDPGNSGTWTIECRNRCRARCIHRRPCWDHKPRAGLAPDRR